MIRHFEEDPQVEERDTFEYFSPRTPHTKRAGTFSGLVQDLYGSSDGTPDPGASQLSPRYLGESENRHRIDDWVFGAIPRMQANLECAHAIEKGKLPPPLPLLIGRDLPAFEFMDLDYGLENLDQSVMKGIGISSILYELVRSSKTRECTRCRSKVNIYKDPNEVAEHIKEAVQKNTIMILLSGGLATREWASSEGFREASSESLTAANFPIHQLPSDHKVFLLDTCDIHSTTWVSFIRLLPIILRIRDTSLHICSSQGALSSFSRHGTCSLCLQSGSYIPSSLPSEATMASENFDGRCIGATSYSNFISSEITAELVNNLPNSPLKTALLTIVRLRLPPIRLNAQVREYSISQIVLIRKSIELMVHQGNSPLVINAPYSWLSLSDGEQLKRLIDERGRELPILILRGTHDSVAAQREDTPTQTPIQLPSLGNNNYKKIQALPAPQSESILLYEWLEIAPRLIRRFASSVAAKMEGITEKDYKRLLNRKANLHTCSSCKGTGSIATRYIRDAVGAPSALFIQCTHCDGKRYDEKIGKIKVKGLTLSEYLNRSIEEQFQFLRTLPTLAPTLDTMRHLGLAHLPLGIPTYFLSPSERLMLGFVKVLQSLPQPDPRLVPSTVFLITGELPAGTLSPTQRMKLAQIITLNSSANVQWELKTDAPEFRVQYTDT